MLCARLLAYITATVSQELLFRNEYLEAEQPDQGGDEKDEKNSKMAHRRMRSRTGNPDESCAN